MDTIKILVVDDHTLFREGLLLLLDSTTEIDVVGEAETGQEAVELARTTEPDVILMDIMMPELNGIQATRTILEEQPEVGIIMLTMLENDDSLFAAMRAGARGYILKGADKTEVLTTIKAVAEGQALFGPAMASRLTNFFNFLFTQAQAEYAFPELTDREREVLDYIARGYNNQEIADRLSISVKTVSNHISSIYNKLQVADRAQAIVKAREAGMGREDDPLSGGD